MAATKEKLVKNRIKKVLDELGAWHCMPMGTGYGKAGVPDIIGCYRGMMFGIEAKAEGGKTTALQDRELSRIRQSGGYSCVVNEDNVDKLNKMIEGAYYIYMRMEA